MKQADFSVGVGKNPNVQQVANCHIESSSLKHIPELKRIPELKHIPDLLKAVKHMGFVQQTFYAMALFTIVSLLVLANGGFAYIAGFTLPSTWICLASYATCIIFSAALINTPHKAVGPVGTDCSSRCCSKSFSTYACSSPFCGDKHPPLSSGYCSNCVIKSS